MLRPGSMRSRPPPTPTYRNGKLSRRAERSGQPAYYIDKVEIINKSRLSRRHGADHAERAPDKVRTYESLEAGIRRLYALESFDRITYEVEERDGRTCWWWTPARRTGAGLSRLPARFLR